MRWNLELAAFWSRLESGLFTCAQTGPAAQRKRIGPSERDNPGVNMRLALLCRAGLSVALRDRETFNVTSSLQTLSRSWFWHRSTQHATPQRVPNGLAFLAINTAQPSPKLSWCFGRIDLSFRSVFFLSFSLLWLVLLLLLLLLLSLLFFLFSLFSGVGVVIVLVIVEFVVCALYTSIH